MTSTVRWETSAIDHTQSIAQPNMSSTLQQKQCPMCSFVCPSIALLLSHLRLVHSSDPRFLVCCGINSCTVTSKSFSSLYSHVYRHHPSECIRHRSHNSFPTVRNESESRLEDNTQFQFLSGMYTYIDMHNTYSNSSVRCRNVLIFYLFIYRLSHNFSRH